MNQINWGRFALASFVAALLFFMSDGLLHSKIVDADWRLLYENLGSSFARNEHEHEHATDMLYFAVFELGRGALTLFLYVTMRSRFGAGPKTAIGAGLIGGLSLSVFAMVQLIPLGFYSLALLAKAGAFQVVANAVGAVAGAALYKES